MMAAAALASTVLLRAATEAASAPRDGQPPRGVVYKVRMDADPGRALENGKA